MPISDIKAPNVNMIPVDPSSRMNTVAALTLWNKVIAEYRNGDLRLDQKISTYVERNDARVLALEEKVRMQPKFVEEALRTLLNDPDFKIAMASSVSSVPGWGVSMGSAVKALLEEPKVIEFHEHEDPATGRLTGVTATVQCGEVVKTSVFSATNVEHDNDADGITDEIVSTLTTDDFDGVPASFKVWIGATNATVAPAVGQSGQPGFIPAMVLTSYHRTGLSAVVIDLSPRFQAATTDEGVMNPPDIDGDALIGLDLPQVVKDALAALRAALATKAEKDAAVATATTALGTATQAKANAQTSLDDQAAAIAGDQDAAEEMVATAEAAVTAAETSAAEAATRSQTAASAAATKTAELEQAEQALQAKQTEQQDAQAAGADQATLDDLAAQVTALTESRDTAQQAKAAADQEVSDADSAKTAADGVLETRRGELVVAQDELNAVVSVLVPLRAALATATNDETDAMAARDAAVEAAAAAALHAEAANIAFVAAKNANGIGSAYGV